MAGWEMAACVGGVSDTRLRAVTYTGADCTLAGSPGREERLRIRLGSGWQATDRRSSLDRGEFHESVVQAVADTA